MPLYSIRNFEKRWAKLRKLAASQLKDLEKDRKTLAVQIRRHKVKKDVARLRAAVAHSKRLAQAAKATRKFIAAKDKVVREAARRGKLLKRALT
jgi:hypothetical protein